MRYFVTLGTGYSTGFNYTTVEADSMEEARQYAYELCCDHYYSVEIYNPEKHDVYFLNVPFI